MTAEEFKNTIIPFSRKLYPLILRILKNEEETRDALQDIMVKLWSKRADLLDCQNQSAFIITVTKNYCFDLLKKKRPAVLNESNKHQLLLLAAPQTSIETKEKYKHVQSIIDQLPEKYKTVICLRDIDGFEFDEIKEMTGFEVPHLRVILSRARQKVKQELDKIYDYEDKTQLAGKIL